MEFCGHTFSLSTGVPVGYATATSLTDGAIGLMPGCRGDLSVLKPAVMVGVPLILDRIRKMIYSKIEVESLGH